MIRENSDSLPTDLVIEILLRLPAKSIMRFRCVSKTWRSMIGSQHFTDLFRTKSSTRPRLLFAIENGDGWCLWTSPQPHNPYEKSSSLLVTADLHMNFIRDNIWKESCDHASGLICFYGYSLRSQEDNYIIICNPSTGQFVNLPIPRGSLQNNWRPFIGYDPIDKQIKVLSIPYSSSYEKEDPYQILTLGTGNNSWRKIHRPVSHFTHHNLRAEGICINGVLYYFSEQVGLTSQIVCFDVRSETFKFIYRDFISPRSKLINYKGQLGVISLNYTCSSTIPPALTLCMWVIKDVEKPEPEWSEHFFGVWRKLDFGCDYSAFLEHEIVDSCVRVAGVTASGDIVLAKDYKSPFHLFYLNPEKKTLQRVEIQGLGAADHGAFEKDNRRVKVFVDHIEDLKVIKTTTYAETSISPSKTEA